MDIIVPDTSIELARALELFAVQAGSQSKCSDEGAGCRWEFLSDNKHEFS